MSIPQVPLFWGNAKEGFRRLGIAINSILKQLNSEGEFTATLTGFVTNPTGTVRWSRQGNRVTFNIPSIYGTSNATGMTMSGVPAELVPANDNAVLARLTDNGVTSVGLIWFQASGTVTLYPTVAGGSWTASGTKGSAQHTVTFLLI